MNIQYPDQAEIQLAVARRKAKAILARRIFVAGYLMSVVAAAIPSSVVGFQQAHGGIQVWAVLLGMFMWLGMSFATRHLADTSDKMLDEMQMRLRHRYRSRAYAVLAISCCVVFALLAVASSPSFFALPAIFHGFTITATTFRSIVEAVICPLLLLAAGLPALVTCLSQPVPDDVTD